MIYDCCFSSDKLYKQILEEIRETIKDKNSSGITQKLLASELGISREQLTRLLNGEYGMKSDYLFYLIVRLGLDGIYFRR